MRICSASANFQIDLVKLREMVVHRFSWNTKRMTNTYLESLKVHIQYCTVTVTPKKGEI